MRFYNIKEMKKIHFYKKEKNYKFFNLDILQDCEIFQAMTPAEQKKIINEILQNHRSNISDYSSTQTLTNNYNNIVYADYDFNIYRVDSDKETYFFYNLIGARFAKYKNNRYMSNYCEASEEIGNFRRTINTNIEYIEIA